MDTQNAEVPGRTRKTARKMALLKVGAVYIVTALAAFGAWLAFAHAQSQSTGPAAGTASELRVERSGEEIRVHAQADVDADRALAWSTLSDYDRLAEFIPGMSASRMMSRDGSQAVIEQKGSAGFGPFRHSFVVVLGVKETQPETIIVTRLGGDFRRFEARYDLVPLGPNRTRIVYRASLVPATPVLPFVGLPVMRSMVRGQFDALVHEVQRRANAG